MGTASFPGVKRPGRGVDHPPPSKRRGHERVGLYLYSPSGPQRPVIGRTFTSTCVNRGLVIGLHRVGEMLPLFYIRSFGNYESEMVTREILTYHSLAIVTKFHVSSSKEHYTSHTNLDVSNEYNTVLKWKVETADKICFKYAASNVKYCHLFPSEYKGQNNRLTGTHSSTARL